MSRTKLLAEYTAACDYPGRLDVAAAESALSRWCAALGVKREVVRLGPDWVEQMPLPLWRNISLTLDDFARRSGSQSDHRAALDARAARAARDARAALDAERCSRCSRC